MSAWYHCTEEACPRTGPTRPPPQYWEGLKLKDNDIVRTIFFLFWFITEPIRYYAGMYGNLQENVSAAGGARAQGVRGGQRRRGSTAVGVGR